MTNSLGLVLTDSWHGTLVTDQASVTYSIETTRVASLRRENGDIFPLEGTALDGTRQCIDLDTGLVDTTTVTGLKTLKVSEPGRVMTISGLLLGAIGGLLVLTFGATGCQLIPAQWSVLLAIGGVGWALTGLCLQKGV